MTAAERLQQIDKTPPAELIARAEAALIKLIDVLSRETMLLRAGKLKAAGELAAAKAVAAEDYTVHARSIQRVAEVLNATAPEQLSALRKRHESLATQMAENLRVLATARAVAEDLLTDVATAVGAAQAPKTYGAQGVVAANAKPGNGFTLNRSL